MVKLIKSPNFEYLVIHTGYTHRMLYKDVYNKIKEFEKEFILAGEEEMYKLLFVHETVWTKKGLMFPYNGEKMDPGTKKVDESLETSVPNKEELDEATKILKSITKFGNTYTEYAVFKCNDFRIAMQIAKFIEKLNYCVNFGIYDIEYIIGENSPNCCVINFDTESG